MGHILIVLVNQCLKCLFVWIYLLIDLFLYTHSTPVVNMALFVLVSRMRNPSLPEVRFSMPTDPDLTEFNFEVSLLHP